MAELSFEEIIQLAVDAGRLSAQREAKDAYKSTERRLYALPTLRQKLADDLEYLEELETHGLRERSKDIARFLKSGTRVTPDEIWEALRADLKANIAASEYEIRTLERALETISNDEYYQVVTGRYIDGLTDEEIAEAIPCETTTVWRNRKRLVQRLAVRLYGATASV